MEQSHNTEALRLLYKELDAGNLDAAHAAFAGDCVLHYPGGVTLHGSEGYIENMAPFLEGLPDFEHIIEDILEVGDKVVARFTIPATHTGQFAGLPASGNRVSFTVIGIYRFYNGKIVEAWVEYDGLGLMGQLGANIS